MIRWISLLGIFFALVTTAHAQNEPTYPCADCMFYELGSAKRSIVVQPPSLETESTYVWANSGDGWEPLGYHSTASTLYIFRDVAAETDQVTIAFLNTDHYEYVDVDFHDKEELISDFLIEDRLIQLVFAPSFTTVPPNIPPPPPIDGGASTKGTGGGHPTQKIQGIQVER